MRLANVRLPLFTFLMGGFMMATAFVPSCVTTHDQSASTRWGEITTHGKANTPVIAIDFHGDTRIVNTPLQKSVEAASKNMNQTSCGLVKFNVIWDLDVEHDLPKAMLRGDNTLMSLTVAEAIEVFGEEEGDKLLGYTRWRGAREIFLITELLDDPELAEWVITHEMSHAIGMEHVQLGLMEPTAPFFFYGRPQWERDDLREFCRSYDCQIDMFDECRER